MRSYKTRWASYMEGVAVQASWSEEKGDFDLVGFMTWAEIQTIAGWRVTKDQTPDSIVGEGYVAVPDRNGNAALYTTTASNDFAPNQYVTTLGPKNLDWLLSEKRPAATDKRPFGKLSPAVLSHKFVAEAKAAQKQRGKLSAWGLDVSVTTK